MLFIIKIDTEADNQWDHGREITVENIKYIPRFQELCEKYHIKPTYLVTSEICQDAYAKEIFTDYLSKNTAEIGSHLHSWTTGPFLDKDGYRYNDGKHAFATELPENLLREKIKNLSLEIETSFGKRPTSFRSGRYGFSKEVAKILAEHSYLVDSSVTPYTSWVHNKGIYVDKGGPDFLDYTPLPYKYNFSHYSLLEIPITILPTRFPLNKNKTIASQYLRKVDKNIPLRIFRKLLFKNQPLWLRPFPWMNMDSFKEVYNEAINKRLPYFVMMFHSSELMPNCSAYRSDKKDIDKLYDLLENFFQFLKRESIVSATLTEAAINYHS
ncbi:MAG: hypothetical protein ACTHK0_16525 [Ginsengibacter sp.]